MMFLNSKLIKNWLNGNGAESKAKIKEGPFPSTNLKEKKVLFLEPRGAKANVFSNAMKYPLLGPLRMTTILRQHGYNAIMYHENLARRNVPDKLLKAADILILTLLTQTCQRGYDIAKKYKELNPDGTVIIGGIHPSLNPEEGLPYCDHLCVGEGAEKIIDIIEGKYQDKLIYTEKVKDLTKLAIPDLKAVVNHQRIDTAPILTSLGCPYSCTFCCVTEMYGRKYRLFSIEQTINAIKNYRTRRFFFLDDNFVVNKKRALELFSELQKLDYNFIWLAQVRADLARDEEIIKQMALAGCRRVFIGFESITQDSLNEVNKNTTLQEYINAVKTFHKYGIPIHGMFIFGLDTDDKSVFKNTVEFIKKYGIESAQFLMITPLPGTKFYNSIDKNRFLTLDTDLYDGNHVIIDPKNMTPTELFEGMIWAYEKCYSWISIIRQLIRDVLNFHKENIRPKLYRIRKLFNNMYRSIGFRLILKKLKKIK